MATPFPALRRRVRQIMLTTGVTLPFTDRALFNVISLEPQFSGAVLEDVRGALVWNETKAFVRRERDEEADADTFRLTQLGILNTPT